MVWPGEGSANQGSELDFLLQDQLDGMGNFITAGQGSLAWVEALVFARALNGLLTFGNLMAAQLEPASASIFLPRWQEIYLSFQDPNQFQAYAAQLLKQTNTIPSLNNIQQFLNSYLGNTFLTIEFIPLLVPPYTSFAPPTAGEQYLSPIDDILVHVWQQRDKNDNFLQTYPQFFNTINSYQKLTTNWIPANATLQNVQFTNAGGDGYGNANFQDGYNNPVNVVNGSAIIFSTLATANSTFEEDFVNVAGGLITAQPLEIVDDNNQVHTVYVESVQSETELTLTVPATFNATGRTYRSFGFRAGITPVGLTAFN